MHYQPTSSLWKVVSLCCAALGLAGTATPARAQLVLNINPNTKTLWFTGSATGTPESDMAHFGTNNGRITWVFSAGYYSTASLPDADLLQTSGSGFGGNGSAIGVSEFSPESVVLLSIGLSSDVSQTLTGLGSTATYDYSWMNGFQQFILENRGSLGMTSLGLIAGSDFGAVSVSVSAVPEPSTYAAIAGLGVFGFAAYRRRHRQTV